jgi:hypothetical protein
VSILGLLLERYSSRKLINHPRFLTEGHAWNWVLAQEEEYSERIEFKILNLTVETS